MQVPRVSMEMLAAFIATADRGSIALAAKDLGLTASAVHKRIAKVKDILGVSLLANMDDRLLLTDAGQQFYRDASRVIEHGLLAENKVSARLTRERKLLVGRSAHLPPRLMSSLLRMEHEGQFKGQIHYLPGLTPFLVRRVAERGIHACFGELPIDEPGLLSRVLWEEPIVVCLHARHALATKSILRAEDLREEPMIAVGRELWPRWEQENAEFLRELGVEPRIVADAFGPHEGQVMVAQKIGSCLLPPSDISNAAVVAKPLTPKMLTRRYGLLVREDNRHPYLNEFVSEALGHFSRDVLCVPPPRP